MTSRHRLISSLIRTVEFGLALLFLYLGTTKFFVPETLTFSRALIGAAELIVGVLIVTNVSAIVSTPAVIVIAATEVALFGRPPLAAMACVSAHGLTTWGKIALHARRDKLPS